MFDLDGTLVDTMFGFADLAAEVMVEHHGAGFELARARYLETSGVPFAAQLEIIHPGHGANRAASDEFEERKRAICETTPMSAATRAALRGLRELGLKLVLSSNTGQSFVDDFVSREGFDFDLALGFDASAGLAKGQPHVDRTVAALGLTTDDIWFVGDSLADSDLAHGAGLRFVGREGTFRASAFADQRPGTPTIAAIGELVGMMTTLAATGTL